MIYFAYIKSRSSYAYGKFVVVPKDYWELHRSLSSSFICSMPEGFTQVAEAMYQYPGKSKEGIQALIKAGFVESKDLQQYLS